MKYFQEIENYLWGRLSAEEKKDFERQVNIDKELAEQVAIQRQERELIAKMEENYWLEEMKVWREKMKTIPHESIEPEPRTSQPSESEAVKYSLLRSPAYKRVLQWSTAAAAAILIVIYLSLPSSDSFSIAEERVIPARYDSTKRSSEVTDNDVDSLSLGALFIEAYEALGNQQYEIADELFQIIESNPTAEPWLLQATEYNRIIILLGQNRIEEAVAKLDQIRANDLHRYNKNATNLYKHYTE